jgi:cbb3-type cytochrome oxidase subunit 3
MFLLHIGYCLLFFWCVSYCSTHPALNGGKKNEFDEAAQETTPLQRSGQ